MWGFKPKLISLLRDSMKLPLPPDESSDYRKRGAGSVIPHIRLRRETDNEGINGVLEFGLLKRIGIDRKEIGTDRERIGNGSGTEKPQ
jgi:hypothetical protein